MMSYLRMAAIVMMASFLLYLLERKWKTISDFLSRESTALNLAMVRIAVLIALWHEIRSQRIFTFARLEPALLAPPKGWSWAAALFPRSEGLVEFVYAVFMISAAFALVGLFARPALVATTLSSAYLLTIPQLFGKVDHYHNLIIFCFLLALYPSSDALSADALRRAWHAADRGILERPAPSRVYAEGLNAILILMALMYFFPGTWKVAGSWPHWFSSQNMAYLLYKRMLEITPNAAQTMALRMPPALLVSTYAAVAFEIGMIFLILWRKSRAVAFVLGLAFHNLTNLLMAIPFVALQLCYTALVDWTALFRFFSNKLQIHPITVVYDPHCRLCRRTIATLCNLDWLGTLNPLPNTRLSELNDPSARAAIENSTEMNFAALEGDTGIKLGYDAYRPIASHIVALWPVHILMGIGLVNHFGRAIYRKIAFSRTCDAIGKNASPETELLRAAALPGARLCAGICMSGMVVAGMAHMVNGWPLACYPTFDGPASYGISELTVQAVDRLGAPVAYALSYDSKMEDLLGAGRWNGLTQQQMSGRPFSKSSAAALIRLWRSTHALDRMSSATLSVDTFHLDLNTLTLTPNSRIRLGTLYARDGI